jgi:hypothetical protein
MLRTSLLVTLLALLIPPAFGKQCKVVDPELQGFYEGKCKGGLAHGKGYARGSAEYEGEFRKGLKHGHGVKRWHWGDLYEGEFQDDRKHGRGTYEWGENSPWAGERYVGDFRNDKREGFGTYFWPNGDRFEGQWKDDLRYGLTAMEQRRELARKEREATLGVTGTTVCSSIPVGIVYASAIRGESQGVKDGRVTLRITDVAEAAPNVRPALTEGTLALGDMWEWTPCLRGED